MEGESFMDFDAWSGHGGTISEALRCVKSDFEF